MSSLTTIRAALCAGAIALLLAAGATHAQHKTERAQPVTPEDVVALRTLAHDLLVTGDYERTITVYRKLVELRPTDAQSHYDLAAALSFLAQYADAVAPIREAIRLQPDYLDAHKVAAIIYMQLGRVMEALAPTIKAAELGDTTAMYELVWFYTAGKGIPVNEAEAFVWAQRAANLGHNLAMELMVEVYRRGMYGQAVDTVLAEQWAQKARQAREQP